MHGQLHHLFAATEDAGAAVLPLDPIAIVATHGNNPIRPSAKLTPMRFAEQNRDGTQPECTLPPLAPESELPAEDGTINSTLPHAPRPRRHRPLRHPPQHFRPSSILRYLSRTAPSTPSPSSRRGL